MVYRLKVKKIILHGYTTNLILFFLRTENIECLLNWVDLLLSLYDITPGIIK